MKTILAVALITMAIGCGTVRYRVTSPTDGRHNKTEIQWDVVEVRFNNLWAKILGGK